MRGSQSWARQCRAVVIVLAMMGTSACARHAVVPQWDPAAFRELDTLEFETVGPSEGSHWSTVWLVVIDDHVYIRLGSRAAARMRENTKAPLVSLRIGGREYPQVRAADAATMTDRVAQAMGAKYWTDLFVRHTPHPLTMRLEPEPAAP